MELVCGLLGLTSGTAARVSGMIDLINLIDMIDMIDFKHNLLVWAEFVQDHVHDACH